MKLFVSDGLVYEGMDAPTVTRLRQELGRDTTYIDEATFNGLFRDA